MSLRALGRGMDRCASLFRLSAGSELAEVLSVACLVLGLWLRTRGFLFQAGGFGVDEATWAVMLLELPLVELLIRPIGFMGLSKVAVALFGASEGVFRTLPWVAGVATTLMAPALARRLFASGGARLLFVAIVALHPVAIDFSKEFKPYSVSLALHVGLMLLGLRYLQTRRGLGALLGLAIVGVLFSQDVVFAYPGIFAIIGWEALGKRDRRHLVAIGLAGLVIVGALAAQYVFIWSQIGSDETRYWGDKYDVFFTSSSRSYVSWLFERYASLAAFPGFRRELWVADWLSEEGLLGLQTADKLVWAALHVVGLGVVLVGRRLRETLVLVVPFLTLWLFNLLGFWPFGVFRTNLFLVVYTAALASMAFDGLRAVRSGYGVLIPAGVLVLLPLLVFEDNWHRNKRSLSNPQLSFPHVLEFFARRQQAIGSEREIVLNHRSSCDEWTYYSRYQPEVAPRWGSQVQGFEVRCIKTDKEAEAMVLAAVGSTERPVWLVYETTWFGKKVRKLRGLKLTDYRAGSHRILEIERQ